MVNNNNNNLIKDFTPDQLMEQVIVRLFDYKATPGDQGSKDFLLFLVNEFFEAVDKGAEEKRKALASV